MIVVSIGCPASVGPEVSLSALRRSKGEPAVLVGSELAIRQAAELVGVSARRFESYVGQPLKKGRLYVLDTGPALTAKDLDPRRPTRAAGRSQLAAINAAYDLVLQHRGSALVTGPVSKALIARSGAPGAEHFKGHTEWLQARDVEGIAIESRMVLARDDGQEKELQRELEAFRAFLAERDKEKAVPKGDRDAE